MRCAVFDIALYYERGAWEEVEQQAARLRIAGDAISGAFIQAVGWASGILTGQSA